LKVLVSTLLLALLLAACVGQRGIVSNKSNVFDCHVLLKKQRHQYRKAISLAKASKRRKSNVRSKEQQVVVTSAKKERSYLSESVDTLQQKFAYSEPLAIDPPVIKREINFSNRSNYNLPLANSSTVDPGGTFETGTPFQKFTGDVWVWPGVVFGGVMGMFSMVMFQNQAKLLSRWAKDNKWKARSTLVMLKIGAAAGCLLLGHELYNSSIMIPGFVKISSIAVLAYAIAFYPSKYFPSGAPTFSFLQRKFYDASIFTASAIIMLYAGNRYDVTLEPAQMALTVAYVDLPAEKFGGLHKQMTIVKKEFKQKLKTYLQDGPKEKTRGAKIALTILAVLAAIALTFGVAALSCSLSCSGSEAAAIFVAVGGVGLIVGGLVATIRSIHNRPTKKRVTSVQSAS
jgi:hypothetical protein